ncbi:hypothetical protein [Bacillus wiedmannii]
MVQNIKTPDQLAVIAFCLIFVSRSSSVIQGLAVLSLLKNPFIYFHIIIPIKMVIHFIFVIPLFIVKIILHIQL